MARTSVGSILKQGGRGSTGSRQMRGFSSALVVLELALTLVLLVGAGLMARSFMALTAMNTGIKPDHLVSMRINLPRANYPTAEVRAQFFERLTPRLASLPGADAAAVTTSMPPFGLWTREVLVDGRPDGGRGKRLEAGYVIISPSFFDTVGVPIRRGRAFDARDGGKGAEVAIVNERFVARHFPGAGSDRPPHPHAGRRPRRRLGWLTIVGVSPDIRHGNPRDRDLPDVVYVPVKQVGPSGAAVILRSRLDPAGLVATVRREVQQIDPDQAVANPRTVDQMLTEASWPFRVFGTLFGILAFIALTLASVGLYAVIAYSVSTRTQEIGVRMALGAGRGTVGWLVLRRGLWQLAIGLAIGLGGAWAVGKYVLASIVAQISGTDPAIFVGVPVLLSLVALAACYLPARRAARLDPLEALRSEYRRGASGPGSAEVALPPRCDSVCRRHSWRRVLLTLMVMAAIGVAFGTAAAAPGPDVSAGAARPAAWAAGVEHAAGGRRRSARHPNLHAGHASVAALCAARSSAPPPAPR